jgi:uncharacterized protein
MRCPTDDTTLVMSERAGVEIDYCPECRGVWLDRGELDKILEKSAAVMPAMPAAPVAAPAYGDARSDDRRYDERRYDQPHYGDPRYDQQPRKRKKENFLMELFGD